MILNDAKTIGVKKEFGELEQLMKGMGFVRWSWDYGKATYDYKMTLDGVDYYLCLRGVVVNNKRLEHPKALLKLEQPYFARHFFPHGLDKEAEVPAGLQDEVNAKLVELTKVFKG